MIHIPNRYSYIECYLTLRCNLKCSYCINSYGGVVRSRRELSAREWAIGINNLETSLPVTLGGGEPTIHPGFYEIINSLRKDIKVDLLTNGQFKTEEFIEKTTPDRFTASSPEYKSIRLSYHAKSMDAAKLVEKARILESAGFSVGIFSINHPENLKVNIEMTERCRKAGVFFFVRDFLGYYGDRLYGGYRYFGALNGNLKKCLCRIEEFLVGPDGSVYRCHRDMYEGAEPVGNLLNIAFDVTDEFRPCGFYGRCNPCDIKMKLGPDLVTNKCSVEIKEEE